MADLTTLEAVKAYLGIKPGTTDADALLASFITSESARFASLVGRDVSRVTYTATMDGNGGTSLMLAAYPVASVTSVTVDGETVPSRPTVDGDGWVVDTGAGIVRLVGYVFTKGTANVVIVYAAGYASVPAEVAQAVNEMVADAYRRRDRTGIMQQVVQGESVQYQVLSLPISVQAVVDAYRAWSIG